MKTLQKYRNVLALGLILILLPVFAVKSFHFHSEKEHIHVEKILPKALTESVKSAILFLLRLKKMTIQLKLF